MRVLRKMTKNEEIHSLSEKNQELYNIVLNLINLSQENDSLKRRIVLERLKQRKKVRNFRLRRDKSPLRNKSYQGDKSYKPTGAHAKTSLEHLLLRFLLGIFSGFLFLRPLLSSRKYRLLRFVLGLSLVFLILLLFEVIQIPVMLGNFVTLLLVPCILGTDDSPQQRGIVGTTSTKRVFPTIGWKNLPASTCTLLRKYYVVPRSFQVERTGEPLPEKENVSSSEKDSNCLHIWGCSSYFFTFWDHDSSLLVDNMSMSKMTKVHNSPTMKVEETELVILRRVKIWINEKKRF